MNIIIFCLIYLILGAILGITATFLVVDYIYSKHGCDGVEKESEK